jgi:hypothetical protein
VAVAAVLLVFPAATPADAGPALADELVNKSIALASQVKQLAGWSRSAR